MSRKIGELQDEINRLSEDRSRLRSEGEHQAAKEIDVVLADLYRDVRAARATNGSPEARERVVRAARIDERLEREILAKND